MANFAKSTCSAQYQQVVLHLSQGQLEDHAHILPPQVSLNESVENPLKHKSRITTSLSHRVKAANRGGHFAILSCLSATAHIASRLLCHMAVR
eukprot:390316-Amphidinium_carterae.1